MRAFIEISAIWDATNFGLDILTDIHDDINFELHAKRRSKFKIHDESTPSTGVYQASDNTWLIRNYALWDKPKNAIAYYMHHHSIDDFYEACNRIGEDYGILGKKSKRKTYEYDSRKSKKSESHGQYVDIEHLEWSEELLKMIGTHVKQDHVDFFNCKPIKQYGYVKKDENGEKVHIYKSTSTYPILHYDYGDWGFMYHPFPVGKWDAKTQEFKKGQKFYYIGEKPKDFVFGLAQLKAEFYKRKEGLNITEEDVDAKGRPIEQAIEEKKGKEARVPYAVICTGQTDATNVRSCGNQYWPVCLGSESITISPQVYKQLKTFAVHVLIVGDIDDPGQKSVVRTCVKFMNIRNVVLPDWLKQKRFGGKPGKDLRQFLRFAQPVDFDHLVERSTTFKFYKQDYSKRSRKYVYDFCDRSGAKWLNAHGFFTVNKAKKNEREKIVFGHIINNVCQEVTDSRIKRFVLQHVENELVGVKDFNALYNALNSTGKLKKDALNALPEIRIPHKHADEQSQWFFFRNKTVEVRKDKITYHRPENVDKIVWSKQVIDADISEVKEPLFKIEKDALGRWVYKPTDKIKGHPFHEYLWDTCRIHWKLEEYEEKELTEEQDLEQQQFMVNKIWSLGYLLHSYKPDNKAYLTLLMDHLESEVGESSGGTGKSIFCESVRRMKNTVSIDGKTMKPNNDSFMYDQVNEETEYIVFEDLKEHIGFEVFYAAVTGDFNVNQKNAGKFAIDKHFSPKIAAQTNYGIPKMQGSTTRRLNIVPVSDYYHDNGNGQYREYRTPFTKFGKNLFTHFTRSENDLFFNMMMQCCQFQLLEDKKVEPPMSSIKKRNYRAEMGETFKAWADSFFSGDGTLNSFLQKKELCEKYNDTVLKSQKVTPHKFKKKMLTWCLYNGHVLNPTELTVSDGRIMKRIEGKVIEMLYIQTVFEHELEAEPPKNDIL